MSSALVHTATYFSLAADERRKQGCIRSVEGLQRFDSLVTLAHAQEPQRLHSLVTLAHAQEPQRLHSLAALAHALGVG